MATSSGIIDMVGRKKKTLQLPRRRIWVSASACRLNNDASFAFSPRNVYTHICMSTALKEEEKKKKKKKKGDKQAKRRAVRVYALPPRPHHAPY